MLKPKEYVGVDSLIAIKIRSHVVSFIKHKTDFGDTKIIGNLIYTYSSIDALTRFVFNTSNGVQSTEDIIQELIQKHTEGLPQTTAITNGGAPIRDSKANVLLTGCTGSLGSHILLQLLSLKNVERVYCLVRNTDTENSIRERLMVQFGVYGLPKELLAEKASSIVILPADLSVPNLGLSASTKQKVCEASFPGDYTNSSFKLPAGIQSNAYHTWRMAPRFQPSRRTILQN